MTIEVANANKAALPVGNAYAAGRWQGFDTWRANGPPIATSGPWIGRLRKHFFTRRSINLPTGCGQCTGRSVKTLPE
jgi:hypothetical protein